MNSKLTSEFWLPERNVKSILARTIGVALTTELRAELLLTTAVAQRLGIGLDAAYVPESFQQVNRGLFDREYMDAVQLGAERAKNGTASRDRWRTKRSNAARRAATQKSPELRTKKKKKKKKKSLSTFPTHRHKQPRANSSDWACGLRVR